MFSDDWARSEVARAGIVVTVLAAIACALAAATVSGRCSGDDTFSLSDPAADPSSYCEATGLADGLGNVPVVLAIFATPVLVAALGSAVATSRSSTHTLRRVTVLVTVLVALDFASLFLANVAFRGHG
jgi:hypothetical protein